MSEERSILDLVINALEMDGGNHKQWYLEQILLKLVGEDGVEKIKKEEEEAGYSWEEGIAP